MSAVYSIKSQDTSFVDIFVALLIIHYTVDEMEYFAP